MIIKNPLNVLAKHYKLINALILIPMIYLLLKYRDIAVFFRSFVASNYKNVESDALTSYITPLCVFATVFMVAYNGFMYLAFVTKKKKGLLYLISAIVYIVLIIMLMLFRNTISGLDKVEPTFANFVRDMANLSVIPQYVLVLLTVVSASGFNIRTLRFDRKSGLEVNEDEEEIEIKLGNDKNATKRNMVHFLRELKYYVLENKFVFSILGVVFAIIILTTLYFNIKVKNRVYNINQEVTTDTFNIALKESYICNVDYSGKTIDANTYFLVVKMGLKNNGRAATIDTSVFRITVGDDVLLPSYERSYRFVDIGRPYAGETIQKDEELDYVFVYELKESQVKGNYQMKILNTLKAQDGKLDSTYKVFNVKPKNLTKKINLGEVKTGKEIKLKDTTLGNSTIEIDKISIETYYEYTYDRCVNDNCYKVKNGIVPSPGTVLMIVKDDINLDKKSSYYKNTQHKFYEDFVTLVLKPAPIQEGVDRNEITSPMKEVTPAELKGKLKVFEVSNELIGAEKIKMLVRIRNWYFTILIKD